MLAVALRGTDGVARWRAAVGPEDPELARITDPKSLRATLGGMDRADNALTVSASLDAAAREVALLFGGRIGANVAAALQQQQPAAAAAAASDGDAAAAPEPAPLPIGGAPGRPAPLPLVVPAAMERVWAALRPETGDAGLCRALALLGAKGLALGHLARADLRTAPGT